jgi:hypothetical protein
MAQFKQPVVDTTSKDKIIARQSQTNAALTYFQLIGKEPKISDVVKLAAMMEKFIISGYSAELNAMMERADEIISQIPNKK